MAVPKVNLRTVKRKKGISYMIDYAVDGKRYREAVGTNKRDAEVIQAKKQSDLAMGKFQIPVLSSKNISIDGIVKEFISHKTHELSANSIKRYENYFTPFQTFFEDYFPVAAQNIKLIKPLYVRDYINSLLDKKDGEKAKWAKKTVNGMIGAAKQLFSYAIAQSYLDTSPFEEISKYKLPTMGKLEYFKESELELIWKNLDPYWVDPLQFIAHTGLRKGEMINLKWENVLLDTEKPQIVITSDEDWQTKSGGKREIQLNKNALAIIERAKGKHAVYVFVSKTGKIIHPDQPLRALKKALKACKLTGDVHKLRHTFASLLVMKGESLYTVSILLGHSDLAMTQIYAHLSPDHLKDSVSKLES